MKTKQFIISALLAALALTISGCVVAAVGAGAAAGVGYIRGDLEAILENDVEEVYNNSKQAIERARKGEGPTLINCLTYRHHTHFEGDLDVRDKKEVDAWLAMDPIKNYEARLLKEKILDEVKIKDYREKIQKMVDEAVDFARKSPKPTPDVAFEDVYAD